MKQTHLLTLERRISAERFAPYLAASSGDRNGAISRCHRYRSPRRLKLLPVGNEQAVVGEVVAPVDRGAVLAADHAQRHADPAGFRVVARS